MFQRDDPRPVKARRWLVFVVVLVGCVCGAVYAYQGMNSDGYRAGNWALVICVPLVGIPLLYGVQLVSETYSYARFRRRAQTAYLAPAVPTCDLCDTRPASWNTRTNEWMDTCRDCRNPDYYDNDHMIG
jgi:hypothetical protein